MSVRWKKVPTTGEVYSLLLRTHIGNLGVFESFSDPEGSYTGHTRGEMQTVWGLKGADAPLMGARSTWDIVRIDCGGSVPYTMSRGNEQHEYWLCKPVEEHDDD